MFSSASVVMSHNCFARHNRGKTNIYYRYIVGNAEIVVIFDKELLWRIRELSEEEVKRGDGENQENQRVMKALAGESAAASAKREGGTTRLPDPSFNVIDRKANCGRRGEIGEKGRSEERRGRD